MYKSLKEEGEWGWGMMKWTEDKAGRGWGVKVKLREESKNLMLLMGKKGRGGMSKRRTEEGRGVWVEALLNEEAEEPFLLLSNCMLLCLCSGEEESTLME